VTKIPVDTGIWAAFYAAARQPHSFPVLTGFNANIDRIIPVTPLLLESLRRQSGPCFDRLVRRLLHSMRYCSADEMVVRRPEIYNAFSLFFSRKGVMALGGQAGIAAARLHQLGFGPVTCIVPNAGSCTRALLKSSAIIPITFGAKPAKHPDRIHFVLEHSPGLVPLAPGTVPRNNRFIVSPAHESSTLIIPAEAEESFIAEISSCTRAFLSGYQYLKTDEDFYNASRQLARIRAANPGMRTHIECVGGIPPRILDLMVRHILPHADSVGMNEQEIGALARVLALRGITDRDGSLAPDRLVQMALAVSRATGVSRLHLHTFGYYVLVQIPGSGHSEGSRDSLLLAAREAAAAAGGDHRVISPDGLLVYSSIRIKYGPDKPVGIFGIGDRMVIVVPACISLPPRRTTGLGDIISSVAFVADPF